MSRIVFVTTELHPLLPGGGGTVVAELSTRLVGEGHEVTVLLVASLDSPDETTPAGARLKIVSPGVPDDDAPTVHLAAARTAAQAVANIVAESAPDLIEFQDFYGLGFWALSRRDELGLESTRIAVRFHGPMDLIYEASGTGHDETDRVQEVECYRMADVVIAPSQPMGELIRDRYQIEPDRVVVGEPPVPQVEAVTYRPAAHPMFTCLGWPSEVKGSPDFLEAALPLLTEHPDLEIRFVGGEGWSSVESRPMERVLRERIPQALRERVHFTGRVPRDRLGEVLATAWAVVIPSRFESFCLAAHEVRRQGLPLILPDLPAFRPYFSEATGAVVYDGTVRGLRSSVSSLLEQPGRLAALAAAPPPPLGDPLSPYQEPLPHIRHPRIQAGLAIRASNGVDKAVEGAAGTRPGGRAARTLLRVIPAPLARSAVRWLPQGLKDRFRRLASWPAEAERRAREERHRAIREQIEAGRFPELDDPEVSVVIPCYDQGRFLDDALVSVFEQSFDSFEIIVVDDGSTDPETKEVLDGLDYPRVRLIRQTNRGLPSARNAGMAAARGRYLVPLDADDELKPRFLEKLHRALEDEPRAAYAHCWAELFGTVDALFATRPFNPYWLTMVDSVIGGVLMRKEAWDEVGGYDETLVGEPEDWEMWIRLMQAGWGQVQVFEPLFRYRKHGVTLGVEGEVRFERGRRALVDRHPELYAPDALRELKREWYPLLTVIGPSNPLPGEAELIGSADGLDVTWGKYVVDLRSVDDAPGSTLRRLVEELEADPDAASAATTGEPPLVVVRRWNLHDPGADSWKELVVDDPAIGPDSPLTLRPRPGWAIPETMASAASSIQRQRPEEEGRLPDLSRW